MIQEVGSYQLPEIWKQFQSLWAGDRRYFSTLQLMDEQHMNRQMIHQILQEGLGKRKICRKYDTHSVGQVAQSV